MSPSDLEQEEDLGFDGGEGDGALGPEGDPGASQGGQGGEPNDVTYFSSWPRLCESVRPQVATHYRYCRPTGRRHRWLENGRLFPLSASDDDPDYPEATRGTFLVQLYRLVGRGEKQKEIPVVFNREIPHLEVGVRLPSVSHVRVEPQQPSPDTLPRLYQEAMERSFAREERMREQLYRSADRDRLDAEKQRKKARKCKKRARELEAEVEGSREGLVASTFQAIRRNPDGARELANGIGEFIFKMVGMVQSEGKPAEAEPIDVQTSD